MRRPLRILAAITLALAALALGGCSVTNSPEPSPNALSSTDLVEAPKEHDGDTVVFTGEAIGEAMVRGEKAWLHLNDDAYYARNVEEGAELGGYNTGMPVWISAEDAATVTFFGDYTHEGDIVEVAGVFNAACAEHGGDTDIHGTALRVVEVGHVVVDRVHPEKVYWAFGLAAVALALYAFERYLRKVA